MHKTYTVRTEAPSLWSALPLNKAFQFVVGLMVIFAVFKMWQANYFSVFLESQGVELQPRSSDGMGSIGLLPFLIDSVCAIGLIAMIAVQMVLSTVGPLWAGWTGWMTNFRAETDAQQDAHVDAATDAQIATLEYPPQEIINADHESRIRVLEATIKPAAPKTARKTTAKKATT